MVETDRSSRLRRLARTLDDHPVVVVALLGVAFVVFQWWWITNARFFGALDTDEGSSVSTSLQFHRALAISPAELWRAALGTGSGPLVPVLSVPFVVLFGRSATSPMFVQPVLIMLSAIGASGAVNRLAGKRAAVLAGLVTLAMPALITSSRTAQYSTGVGAAMCLAIWALLASDRGRRMWPTIAFGAAVGAMTISRTMSVSFLPAMVGAALVATAVRERRVWRNLALGAVAALVVALPWWLAQWDYVSTYLLSSGYGDRSAFFGSEAIIGRLGGHVGYLLRDFRVLLPLGAFVAVLAGIEGLRRARRAPRAWLSQHCELIAVWVAIALGSLALLSSSNRGYWFATPLDSLLVIAVVASGALLLVNDDRVRLGSVAGAVVPALWVAYVGWMATGVGIALGLVVLVCAAVVVVRMGPRAALATGVLTTGVCVAVLAASVPLVGPSARIADTSVRGQLVGGLEPYMPTVHEADARLSSPDIDVRRRAAAEWAAAAEEIDEVLLELEATMSIGGSGTLSKVVTGSRGLFEINTIGVARELGPRGVTWLIDPNTFETPEADLMELLTPKAAGGTPRIIIAIEGRAPPFPNSLGWHRLVRLAEQNGWVVHHTIPLPDRGRVVIYVHPDNLRRDLTDQGS